MAAAKTQGKGKAKKRAAQYTDAEVAIRDAARKLCDGSKPLPNPIRCAQVRMYMQAANGTAGDPFAEGGALHGIKVADARKLAAKGGRAVGTSGISAWRKAHRRQIPNSALASNRVVAALALASREVAA